MPPVSPGGMKLQLRGETAFLVVKHFLDMLHYGIDFRFVFGVAPDLSFRFS